MRVALLFIVALITTPAEARDSKAIREFKRENPCPANGHLRGKCPGYVVDHIIPLCAGGEDKPRNMQWQTVKASREKDVIERRQCRAGR